MYFDVKINWFSTISLCEWISVLNIIINTENDDDEELEAHQKVLHTHAFMIIFSTYVWGWKFDTRRWK